MIERFHRQLKAAIKCHETNNWVEISPVIMLRIRTAIKDDLKAFAAEMVYGIGIRLPGELLGDQNKDDYNSDLQSNYASTCEN